MRENYRSRAIQTIYLNYASLCGISENRFPAEVGQAFPLDNFQHLLAYEHLPFHEREASLMQDTNE